MLRDDLISSDLVALPQQPANLSWPTTQWSRADLATSDNSRTMNLADQIFNLESNQGVTYALLIVKSGKLVYERYDAGANAFYLQYSWSMAKSITQALVGILVKQGRLDLEAPAPVPEWQGDKRAEITLDQLLKMRSGLQFSEDYVDGEASDVIPMLTSDGRFDTGAFAASKPLAHPPGQVFSYSSGTTNIICRIIRDAVGGSASDVLRFMTNELFEPIGMRTPVPRLDHSGTFIGSSYLLATPQEFARFGYLYLRGGNWDGRQLLPEGWVDYARSPSYLDTEQGYGAHWWLNPQHPDWFYASGYDGQRILLLPEQDAMIIRLGRTPSAEVGHVWDRVNGIAELL